MFSAAVLLARARNFRALLRPETAILRIPLSLFRVTPGLVSLSTI